MMRALVSLLILVLALVACSSPQPDAETRVAQGAEGATGDAGADVVAPAEPIRRLNVLIYYPAAQSEGLIGEPREIFMTAARAIEPSRSWPT